MSQKEQESTDNSGLNYGEDYLSWKDWHSENFGVLTSKEHQYFLSEIKKAKKHFGENSAVLEIGFGNGGFLQFGRLNGWNIDGLEINENLVKIANESGFTALHAEDLSVLNNETYDLVIAFDVLEHIPQHKILPFLTEIKRILKHDGCFIARFPNGDSPFGLSYQNGDVTHVSFIGSGKIMYFINRLQVELVYIGGQACPFYHSMNPFLILTRVAKKTIVKMLSYFYDIVFSKPYYFSSNLVVILKKTEK